MENQSLDKTDLLMLILYSKGQSGKNNEPIVGITRLMKLLFLLNKENNFEQFEFEPYKMGPFSSDVYPELEFLQNFPTPDNPFVVTKNGKEIQNQITPEGLRVIEEMSEDEEILLANEVNKSFALSDLGKKIAEQLWFNNINESDRNKIEKIKSYFGSLTLKELLRYVYKKYPEMTINSEIKDQL